MLTNPRSRSQIGQKSLNPEHLSNVIFSSKQNTWGAYRRKESLLAAVHFETVPLVFLLSGVQYDLPYLVPGTWYSGKRIFAHISVNVHQFKIGTNPHE